MRTGLEQARADRRRDRRALRLSLLALLLIFAVYVCTRSTAIGFVAPVQAASNLFTALKLELAKLLKWPLYDSRLSIIEAHPYYLETMTRLQGAALAVVLGAAMSAAGVVYQSVFRNPIATPAMLGVSSGISLANLALVLQFSTAAATMTTLRYAYGYLFSIGLLALVLLCGKLMTRRGGGGGGKGSVTDVLLAGTVVTRLAGHVVTMTQTYWMGEDDLLIMQEMNLYGTGIGNSRGALFLAGALLLGLLPVYLMRFSFNAAAFPDEDARLMGVNPDRLRYAGLVFSTILIVAAQVHAGDVALLALLVPHICRHIFGAEMRSLLPGSILWGAIIMLLCRGVVALFAFNRYLSVISIGTIVNLVGTPLMIFILLKNRRGWD